MAKVPASQLVTDLLNRLNRNTVGVPERADALRQLNYSQSEIVQEHSLRFLVAPGTLSVVAGSVAVPATVDDSKLITLGRVSGDGDIDYVELDRWYEVDTDTYLQSAQTEPYVYTIAGATFLFKPTNFTGSVPYIAQLLPVDMTDASNSFSVLPAGWEVTLLLIDAEYEMRRNINEPQTAELLARRNTKREALYGSYRTSKIQAKTDREQKERKIEKAQLSDEAEP
jgi:hypothetical protein